MKKISISLFLILLCTGYLFAQKNKNTALEKYSEISYKIVMNGDAISSINTSSKRADIRGILKHLNTQQDRFPLYNTTFTYTGCSTIYDMTSNATPQNIIQDPTNPNRIHIVCMSSPPGDPSPGFPNRTTKYYFSSNKGQSWIFVSNIPGGRSGYPVITLMANGNELIANYSGSPSTTKYYYDAAPGLGSFTELYHTPQMDYIWPRIAVTNSLTNPVKLLSIVSPNGRDSCFLMKCLSLSPTPGTF
ncbi:MAG: hypothetical protein NTU73_11930, partial [Ignavibacteriae bacterium]|nr:hypothetical protein [Ignavibacteriota bacterium]